LHIGLKTLCIEMGVHGQLFAQDWDSLHLLTTLTWLGHTWKFQNKHGIWIKMTTPNIPLSRKGNKLLTAAFYHLGICGKELAMLNQCCMFLQVVTIASIMDGSGYYIANPMLTGSPNQTFTSGYTWPNQGKPSKQEWANGTWDSN